MVGLILCRSCAGSHSCCAFPSAKVLACAEDTVLLLSSPSSGSLALCIFSPALVPEPWGWGVIETSHLWLSTPQSFFFHSVFFPPNALVNYFAVSGPLFSLSSLPHSFQMLMVSLYSSSPLLYSSCSLSAPPTLSIILQDSSSPDDISSPV